MFLSQFLILFCVRSYIFECQHDGNMLSFQGHTWSGEGQKSLKCVESWFLINFMFLLLLNWTHDALLADCDFPEWHGGGLVTLCLNWVHIALFAGFDFPEWRDGVFVMLWLIWTHFALLVGFDFPQRHGGVLAMWLHWMHVALLVGFDFPEWHGGFYATWLNWINFALLVGFDFPEWHGGFYATSAAGASPRWSQGSRNWCFCCWLGYLEGTLNTPLVLCCMVL